MAAECLPPEVTEKRIYEAAKRAMSRLEAGQAPQPLSLPAPVKVTIELVTSDMADRAAIVPGVRRLEGKRIELTADDVPSAYRAFRAAVSLAVA
jgi:D-aminopeptidase